jgi:hypothetical protein
MSDPQQSLLIRRVRQQKFINLPFKQNGEEMFVSVQNLDICPLHNEPDFGTHWWSALVGLEGF